MQSKERVRSDFDQVAVNIAERVPRRSLVLRKREHLIKYVPAICENALDIGCGLGDFARYLAGRSTHVLALDLSPEMIRLAREQSAGYPNIEFQVVDALEYDYPAEQFDFVSSFMTVHHMPLEQIFEKAKFTLKPGGTFLVFDICEQTGLRNSIFKLYYDFLRNVDRVLRRLLNKRRRGGAKGMHDHDPDEVRPTVETVRMACNKALPDALVKEMYGVSRYYLVWKKP